MRVAVLGLGSAGRRHAEDLIALGHEVVGWDPEADAPDGVSWATSPDEAISAADAVVVASPSSLHCEQAVAALEAGRPVLIEKPLATNLADAECIAGLAAQRGLVCAVGMNLRFHPAIRRLREIVGRRELGEPLFAAAWFGYDLRRWRPHADYRRSYSARAELGGGILLDAIHELDYLLWILGPVEEVGARLAQVSNFEIDVEDLVVAWLRFSSGTLATVDLNFFEPAYRRGCLIAGRDATARWDWRAGTLSLDSPDGQEEIDVAHDVRETYRAEVGDFVNAVQSGAKPATTAAEGASALRLAEAIRRSASEGRGIELDSVD